MTTKKKVLIACGSLLVIFVLLAIAAVILISRLMPNREEFSRARQEGTEFGKTTDQAGCMAEGWRIAGDASRVDVPTTVLDNTFLDFCLEAARPSRGFCEGVPDYGTNATDWSIAQCSTAGLDPGKTWCMAVARSKQKFCKSPIRRSPPS